MDLKLLFSATLLCSWALLASPQGSAPGSSSLPCLKKILPCQPFLHSPSPPPTCCAPLKDTIENDKACACALFNNEQILKSFNLTQAEALEFPKTCGITTDMSVCKSANNGTAISPTSASTPATPTAPTTPAAPSGHSNTTKSSAYRLVKEGFGLVVNSLLFSWMPLFLFAI